MKKHFFRSLAFFMAAAVLGPSLPVSAAETAPEAETAAQIETAAQTEETTEQTTQAAVQAEAATEQTTQAASETDTADGEDAVPQELNWEDLAEEFEELNLDGDFVTLKEADVKMWLPSSLTPTELTDADRSNGYIGYYTSADGMAYIAAIYLETDGMTLDEYAALIDETEEYSKLAFCRLNGMDAITYECEEMQENYVTLFTDDNHLLEFSFWPVSDEEFYFIAQIIAASIQAA